MRWEYRTIDEKQLNKRELTDIDEILNALGNEGWELIAFHRGLLVFKRPVEAR
jgi:hypothetical protein